MDVDMILPTILFLLTITSYTLGLPLTPSDLGHDGHIVHYHRDNASGKFFRHIHYLPRSRHPNNSPTKEPNIESHETSLNTAPAYEVRESEPITGAEKTSEMSLRIGRLYENNDSVNVISVPRNNSKLHSIQYRDAPSPDKISKATALPAGLQFLNKQSGKKRLPSGGNAPTTEPPSLNLSILLGSLLESTTLPSTSKSDSLDLGYLLGDLAQIKNTVNHDHTHTHSHPSYKHAHSHSHHHPSVVSGPSNTLFRGTFNQVESDHGHGHHGHSHTDHFDPATPKTPTTKTVYHKSTLHDRTITKRGVSDNDSVFPKTFINNILNIKIRNTTPVTSIKMTPPPIVTSYVTTPRTVHGHFEPLSRINLDSVRKMNREQQRKMSEKRNTSKQIPTVTAPSKKELVQLQGIHIMFSNGHAEQSSKVTTIHLTAALSDNLNHMIQAMNGRENSSQHGPHSNESITDKITGTAVIRDGHLYLVIYPFGQNKSLELHYNDTVSRMSLPQNQPVVRKGAEVSTTQTKIQPSTSLTPKHTTPAVHYTTAAPSANVHKDMPDKGRNHGHDHHHGHHKHGPPPSLTDLQLAEVNDTMLQTLLAPIDRFMSPWKMINFSQILPFISKNNTQTDKKQKEEDTEIDVVTFIAKASDPFERIKAIIESLADTSLLNTTSNDSTADAKFNFELKLQQGTSDKGQESKHLFQNSFENNSKESMDANMKLTSTGTPNLPSESTSSNSEFNTERSILDNLDGPSSTLSSFDHSLPDNNEPVPISSSTERVRTTTYQPVANYETTNSDRKDVSKLHITTQSTSIAMKSDAAKDLSVDNAVHTDTNVDSALGGLTQGTSTTTKSPVSTDFDVQKTTFTYLPNYTFSPNVNDKPYAESANQQASDMAKDKPASAQRPQSFTFNQHTILGSNSEPFSLGYPMDNFHHGQDQQLISLEEVLNDIRRIQLQNMQRFNIYNNNFNAMLLSESNQNPNIIRPVVVGGPLYQETSTRTQGRFSDFVQHSPIHDLFPNFNMNSQFQHQSLVTPFPTTTRRRINERSALQNALDAMLVLSVDDVLADQTTLHGAIVLSHRRDTSSSNNK